MPPGAPPELHGAAARWKNREENTKARREQRSSRTDIAESCINTPHHTATPRATHDSAPHGHTAGHARFRIERARPRTFRMASAWGGALSSVGQAQPRSGFWRGCTRRSENPTPRPSHRRVHPRQVPDMPPVTDRGERPTPTPPPTKTTPATQTDTTPSLRGKGPAGG